MWIYYLMLVGAVLLFSVQFVFTKCFQKEKGSTFFYSMVFSAIVGAVSIPFFILLNGGKIEFTPFSLLIAVLYSADAIACSVFGAKTLSRANLSVYSLFMMLGGMLLPFFYGFTLGEEMTWLKGVAMAFVLASMLLTLKKEEGKKSDPFTLVCYAAIFITNGVTGVLTFMHQRATVAIVSESGFLILASTAKAALSLIIVMGILIYAKIKDPSITKIDGDSPTKKEKSKFYGWALAVCFSVGFAIMNGTGSLLSTITASYIEAGVQSTIGTGGCILMSAIFGIAFGEKITKKSLASLLCALAGTVLIVL